MCFAKSSGEPLATSAPWLSNFSFASGVADEALRSIWVTTTVGAAAAFLELRYLHGSAGALQIASFCMAGAIPAAACSWLSNEKQMRARTAH